jgi:DNA-binding beta-propeller fold protein YncE
MRSFDISSHGIGSEQISNALGVAVNPVNKDIFLTTLSYGGETNIWQFSSEGTLINSVRANIDLGPSGSLESAVVGKDGHLFICATKDMGSNVYERSIIEVSQDGNNIFSSFSSDQYTQGGNGIAYNAENNHVFVASYAEKKVYEISLDGTLLNSFDVMNSPLDTAFDPLTKNILIISDKYIMDEYSANIQGKYCALMSYSLKSVGISQHQLALDIDRSSGLFYLQENNNRVVEFNRSELQSIRITHLFGYIEL